jgi:hypothetical protein
MVTNGVGVVIFGIGGGGNGATHAQVKAWVEKIR